MRERAYYLAGITCLPYVRRHSHCLDFRKSVYFLTQKVDGLWKLLEQEVHRHASRVDGKPLGSFESRRSGIPEKQCLATILQSLEDGEFACRQDIKSHKHIFLMPKVVAVLHCLAGTAIDVSH